MVHRRVFCKSNCKGNCSYLTLYNVALWTGNENEGNGHLLKMLFIFTTVLNVKRTLKRISSLFIGHKGFV